MPRFPSRTPIDPIDFLIGRKFPQLTLANLATPNERTRQVADGKDIQTLIEEAARYREELKKLPKAEIDRLVEEAKENARKQEEAARWFNKPDVAADFGYWASASYWTPDEAVALTFGKDPRRVTWKAIESYRLISPFVKAFEDRRELVKRAIAMNQLYLQTMPSFFLAWAERMKIDFPAELRKAVEDLGNQIADWKTFYDKQVELTKALQEQLALEKQTTARQTGMIADLEQAVSANQERFQEGLDEKDQRIAELEEQLKRRHNKTAASRERQTLLKMVLGMAIRGYGYDEQCPNGWCKFRRQRGLSGAFA